MEFKTNLRSTRIYNVNQIHIVEFNLRQNCKNFKKT